MSEMRSLNEVSGSHWLFPAKRSRSILEIDSWMPSKIQAISPLVDRLMRLIEGSQWFGKRSSMSGWRPANLWEPFATCP